MHRTVVNNTFTVNAVYCPCDGVIVVTIDGHNGAYAVAHTVVESHKPPDVLDWESHGFTVSC